MWADRAPWPGRSLAAPPAAAKLSLSNFFAPKPADGGTSPDGGAARIAYVSCNPSSFARDAKIMVEAGWRIDWIQPVGQFRWSTHVELAARFVRQAAG